MIQPTRVGFALTGSFCTHDRALSALQMLLDKGFAVTPILSEAAGTFDTRFGTAAALRGRLERMTGNPIIDTVVAAEPIGPKKLFDVLVIAPCTANTLAKLQAGVVDGTVPMAVKSHLRGGRPVVLAVSTNDALAASAANLGALLARRHYYFVPFRQDAPRAKPRSLVADFTKLPETVEAALAGEQLQPILLAPGDA